MAQEDRTMTTTAYRTTDGFTYVITTGRPAEPVRIGGGHSVREALRDRRAYDPVQSAGSWPRERDIRALAASNVDGLGLTAEELEAQLGDGEAVCE
jgi:hypothetical protein